MSEPRSTLRFSTLAGLARAFRRWSATAEVHSLPAVPGADAHERHALGALGGIAAAIAGQNVATWSPAIQAWANAAPAPPAELTDAVCEALGRRQDPLAALYDVSISAANRRRLGTVFTPEPLVEHMLDLAERHIEGSPACVVDPGAGVGAFTLAAALRWPNARIVAVDVNVVTLGLLAARLAFEIDAEPSHAPALRAIELVLGDYLDQLEDLYSPHAPGPVLVVGNPPYTRIQELPVADRAKAAAMADDIIDSGHANLAALFQAATLVKMRSGDLSCMVLPGSISFTRASRGLRRKLWSLRRPIEVHRTPATTRAFTGRSVQAAVLFIGAEQERRSPLRLARVRVADSSVETLAAWPLARSGDEPENWFWSAESSAAEQGGPLADIAKVRRGVATGANRVFFLTDDEAASLPQAVVVRGIVSLRLFSGEELDADAHASYGGPMTKRWLLSVPPNLPIRGSLRRYLARHSEASSGHLASQRKPWYSITELPRPQLLISPLSKTGFKVVLNTAEAVPSNSLFGISLRNGADPRDLARWLRSEDGQRELRRVSRRYHGGSHKLEPGDLRSVQLPRRLHLAE